MGVLIYNDSQNGNAVCNSFNNCGTGFAFEDIGFGGTPYGPVEGAASGSPSDNSWTPSGMMNQTVTIGLSNGLLVPWYYRASAEYDMLSSLNVATAGANAINIQDVYPAGLICDGFMRTDSTDTLILNHELEMLLDSAILMNSGSVLPNWVYSQLSGFYQNGISNAKIESAIALTNIAEFSSVNAMIYGQEFDQVLNTLYSIVPINDWESNKIGVLEILALAKDSLVNDTISGNLEFINEDFLSLEYYLTDGMKVYLNSMALSDLQLNGEAVNIARAMLDMLIIDGMDSEEARLIGQNIKEQITIYPNPSTTIIYIEAQSEMISDIIINSVSGNSTVVHWNSHNESQIQINISSLTSGIYFLQIMYNSGQSEFGKFIKK